MSKPKHTPGPWTSHFEKDFESEYSIYSDKTQEHIVNVHGSQSADATLIAAAPDMLAMLEYLHEKIDAKPGTYEFDAVKALIAKARGEK